MKTTKEKKIKIKNGKLTVWGNHLVTDDPLQAEFYRRHGHQVEFVKFINDKKPCYYIAL